MNKNFLLPLLIAIFLASSVHAGSFNFAASWNSVATNNVAPGEWGEAKMYFFNIHGDRIAHVTLSVEEAPAEWEIKIQPAIHTVTVDVSGVKKEMQENLYAEPSEPVAEIPINVPQGVEYIKLPSVEGYVKAKIATLLVKPPADEELGKQVTIKLKALGKEASTGTIQNQLSYDLSFKFETKSGTFYETVIEGNPCENLNCSDNNPCTADSCYAGECRHEAKEDGTACGENKECKAGECVEITVGEEPQQSTQTEAETQTTPTGLITIALSPAVLGIIIALVIAVIVLAALLLRKRKPRFG